MLDDVDITQLEFSLINFVKAESLKEIRENSNYSFHDISVNVDTLFNDGVVIDDIHYTNKCCFIAIADGIKKISPVSNIKPIDLMKIADFMSEHDCVDTDIPSHISGLKKLVNYFGNIQLYFYIGNNSEDIWKTTPDAEVIIRPNSKEVSKIIRILNKGQHFEYITSPSDIFIRQSRKMNKNIATSLQFNLPNSHNNNK